MRQNTVAMSCCHSHSVIATWNDSHSILSGQKQGVVNHTHVKLQHNTIKERQNEFHDCELLKFYSEAVKREKKKSPRKITLALENKKANKLTNENINLLIYEQPHQKYLPLLKRISTLLES